MKVALYDDIYDAIEAIRRHKRDMKRIYEIENYIAYNDVWEWPDIDMIPPEPATEDEMADLEAYRRKEREELGDDCP